MKKITLVAIVVALSSQVLPAQEDKDVFLSLTRKAEISRKLPTNISVIDQQEIRDLNANNLGEVLNNEVGIFKGEYGSLGAIENIMLRGCRAEQVLVLIDGRRINDPGMGLVDLSTIPLGNIERVEIIRGAASAIYGTNAFGGIINVITKKPKGDTTETTLDLSYGSFETQIDKLNFESSKNGSYLLFSAEKDLSLGYREHSAYNNLNITLKLGKETKKAGKFDLTSSFYRGNVEVPGSGPTLDLYDGSIEKTATTPNARQEDEKKYIKLENEYKFPNNKLLTNIYYSNDKQYYYSPTWFADNDYDTHVYGFESSILTDSSLVIGAEAWNENFTNFNKMTQTFDIDKSRTNYDLYIQDNFTFNGLSIMPSLRYDKNSSFDSVLSPNLTVIYELDECSKISANAGKAWRAPTFNELYYTDSFMKGNTGLKPEEGISADAGYAFGNSIFKTSLTAFYITTDNLISWEPDASWLYTAQNINSSQQTGCELNFNHKITSGFYQAINYTYLWAIDKTNNRVLNYRPCNKVDYTIKYMPSLQTNINISGQYVSRQETWSTPTQLPEYVLFNAGINHTLGNSLELWLKINNITETKYQTRLGYPLPGRTLFIGIKLPFSG